MADTIRMLIATDNHVGYAERDPIRGDDSWKTFHEIMCIAREQDVDMVLLGGDLFHENKPSRKSMYNVMRSLRLNCFGDKPCELELLSDGSLHFDSTIGHANYEDPDINVAIPVFSIHGNHDDPSGEGLYAALDILEMAGLINYFGRVPESDNITVIPLLFQKGGTKLALYGLSNVRDERLHRTFRDNKVQFKRPGTQTSDWYNVMCVHQNHHAHTETSYLPENQLPDYMDFVVWGHEHECDTIAHKNPECGFKVLQPGSSVATSLIAGEANAKHVFIMSITGRDTKLEHLPLRTVRPFVYKDIVLSQEKEAVKIAKKNDHRSELTRFLEKIVNGLIEQAKKEWEETQGERIQDDDEPVPEFPLPLIRLRVETTSPDGGVTRFDLENPQRFSNRFTDRVANRNDVIQFIARKKSSSSRTATNAKPDEDVLAKYQTDTIEVDKLVEDFLAAQSLSILPTNYFSEAVREYIQKDDKHAMEMFVNDSLANQIKHLITLHDDEDDSDIAEDLAAQIEQYRSQLEELYSKGKMKKFAKHRYKPKPAGWNSDWDGHWEDQPGALIRVDEEDGQDNDDDVDEQDSDDATTRRKAAPASRGRGRGRGGSTARTFTTTANKSRGQAKAKPSRSRKQVSDEDEDIIMIDDDNTNDDEVDEDAESDSQALFFPDPNQKKPGKSKASTTKPASTTKTRGTRSIANNTTTTTTPATSRKPASKSLSSTTTSRNKQSTLTFSQGVGRTNGTKGGTAVSHEDVEEIEDDDDDDDDEDEAFESLPVTRSRRR